MVLVKTVFLKIGNTDPEFTKTVIWKFQIVYADVKGLEVIGSVY